MAYWLKMTLFVIGYIALAGPPRAIEIRDNAERNGGELQGRPLWQVMVVEFVARMALFLLFAVMLESILSDLVHERYRVDLFLGVLIVIGAVHTVLYGLACRLFERERIRLAGFLYRLGRNGAYAIIPAFIGAGGALVWQDFNQRQLFAGDLVGVVMAILFSLFLLAGLIEALVARRVPSGLGACRSLGRSTGKVE
jgi:hypothetical protein